MGIKARVPENWGSKNALFFANLYDFCASRAMEGGANHRGTSGVFFIPVRDLASRYGVRSILLTPRNPF